MEYLGVLYKDLQLAVRGLVRRPGLSLVAVLTFALGIGANTAIFSFVDGVLLTPLPFPDADRLVRVHSVRGGELGKVSMLDLRDLEADTDLFAATAAYREGAAYNFSDGAVPEELPATLTTGNLFDVLGVPLLAGDSWPEHYDRERNFGVVLSHGTWQRAFGGSRDVIGTKITLDGAPNYTVFGVLPPGFDFPVRADLYRSIGITETNPNYEDRSSRTEQAIARLRPGVSITEAQLQLDNLARTWQEAYPDENRGIDFSVVSLNDAIVGEARPHLLLLMGAVVVVLLIASVNVTNLLLSRAIASEREVALRTALGGGRVRLLLQFAMEGVVLALAGGLLGLVFAHWGVRALTSVARAELPAWMTIEIDGSVLLVAFAVALLTGFVAGVVPAWKARASLGETLKESIRGGTGGFRDQRLRGLLIVSEFALALALSVGAALLVKSFHRMDSGDLGFERGPMLTFRVALPWSTYSYQTQRTENFHTEVLRKLRELPGVESATFNAGLPIIASQEGFQTSFSKSGQTIAEHRDNPNVFWQESHPSYFDVMGIPLLEGRAFNELDTKETQPVAIINRHFAETVWPGESALGKRVKLGAPDADSEWRTVVGVVGDVTHGSLVGGQAFDYYTSHLQTPYRNMYFVARTHVAPLTLVEDARRAVLSVDADQSIYDVFTMEERLLSSVWQQRLASLVFTMFAGLALFLASVGIYGVISYSVTQRQREMGVRSALGAGPRDLLMMVLEDGVRLGAWGAAFGLALAFLLARFLEAFLHEVSPADPGVFLGVASVLVAAAAIGSLVPALRARRVDPIQALRHE